MVSAKCDLPSRCLAGFLQEAYLGSVQECPSSSSGMTSITIDGRRPSDVSSDFCSLWVEIKESSVSQFTLFLKNPPLDDEITELIDDQGGESTGSHPDVLVEISLLTKEVGFLRDLAREFKRVVGRGRTYSNANWKWVCPRTAKSLDLLADRLMEYRRTRRHSPCHPSGAASLAKASSTVGGGAANGLSRAKATEHSNNVDEEDIFRLLGGE